MSESLPPSLPSSPPQRNADNQPRTTASGLGSDATYNLLADKIGGVPNFRKKDNLYQGIAVEICLMIGLAVGGAAGGWPMGSLLGAAGGLIVGVITSGVVLLVIGLQRKP